MAYVYENNFMLPEDENNVYHSVVNKALSSE